MPRPSSSTTSWPRPSAWFLCTSSSCASTASRASATGSARLRPPAACCCRATRWPRSSSFRTDLERNRGCLVWLLDHTKSRFGARLLREWIAHPLLDRQAIVERHQAVAVLSTPPVPEPLVRLRASVLGSLPDLERALVRIYYGRCRPREFWLVLAALHNVLAWSKAAAATAAALGEQSPLLASLIGGMDADGAAAKRVAAFMAMLSQGAAERDEMAGLIRDTTQSQGHCRQQARHWRCCRTTSPRSAASSTRRRPSTSRSRRKSI